MEGSHKAPQLVRQVLALADRHGFVQTILDTAPQFGEHLISGSTRYPGTDNLRALVAASLEARKLRLPLPHLAGLPDPLTDAEKRVLQKLPQRLTYVDMAPDLHLSLNTVKTHLRHTYMKLGVTSRSSAVKRASSLGLL
jgi:LuxR family transcriptional regulator, maltose regulon positive regulatory protein